MKLTTRVSAFFLTALALILIGNSLCLFLIARYYLYRNFDQQLESSLHTLVAAVELEEDDVKWDLLDHTVTLGTESGVEDIRWLVVNDRGVVIDRSPNLDVHLDDADLIKMARWESDDQAAYAGWRFLKQRMVASNPKPIDERDPLEHEAITVVVTRSLADLHTTLNWLTVALVVLPTGCWLISAAAGQWFCRQALAPVREMASSARGIRADDTHGRLRVPRSHDELADLGTAFNDLLDQLFAAYERQRRFAGDAAHQLRTPLTVLQGQIQVSLRRQRSAEETEQTLRVLEDEVRSLIQSVESMLFLARPPGEEMVPDFQTLDMSDWLVRYMHKWESDPRWNDISCVVDPASHCWTSPGLLVQLLDILISNSLKYSTPGTRVDVRATHDSDRLRIEVEDCGIGIAEHDLESIFEPFFRARQARQSTAPGTGLGLAIAARVANVLGGSLRCSSRHGEGTTFWWELPIHHPVDASRMVASQPS